MKWQCPSGTAVDARQGRRAVQAIALRADSLRRVPLSRILGGDREIVIEFNGADYRLRITRKREAHSHEVTGRPACAR